MEAADFHNCARVALSDLSLVLLLFSLVRYCLVHSQCGKQQWKQLTLG